MGSHLTTLNPIENQNVKKCVQYGGMGSRTGWHTRALRALTNAVGVPTKSVRLKRRHSASVIHTYVNPPSTYFIPPATCKTLNIFSPYSVC
jgi:hypothetical protein